VARAAPPSPADAERHHILLEQVFTPGVHPGTLPFTMRHAHGRAQRQNGPKAPFLGSF